MNWRSGSCCQVGCGSGKTGTYGIQRTPAVRSVVTEDDRCVPHDGEVTGASALQVATPISDLPRAASALSDFSQNIDVTIESPRFSRKVSFLQKVDGSIVTTLHIAIPKQRILHHDSPCTELKSTNRSVPQTSLVSVYRLLIGCRSWIRGKSMKKPPIGIKAFRIVVLAKKTTIGKSGTSQNSIFRSPVWKGFPSGSSRKRASPKSPEPRSRSVWRRPRQM
jgi:hypothetical protein